MTDRSKTVDRATRAKEGADFGGFEPGQVVDEGWDPGEVVPRRDDTGTPADTGSQVPPPRDTLGNQLDEDGKPVPSVERVASGSIDAAWSGLALKVKVGKVLLAREPRSANDWQLYDMEGAEGAAAELSAALGKATKELVRRIRKLNVDYDPPWSDDAEEQIGRVLLDVTKRITWPVMKANSDFGATDTEPRYVMGQALINAIKDFYRIPRSQWTELGDYVY